MTILSHLPPKRPSPGLQAASWGASGYEQYWLPLTANSPDSLLWEQPVVQGLDSVSQPRATVQLTFSDDLLSNLLWVSSSPKFLIKEALKIDIFHVTENQSFHILPIKYYAAIWNAAVLLNNKKVHTNSLNWKCKLWSIDLTVFLNKYLCEYIFKGIKKYTRAYTKILTAISRISLVSIWHHT